VASHPAERGSIGKPSRQDSKDCSLLSEKPDQPSKDLRSFFLQPTAENLLSLQERGFCQRRHGGIYGGAAARCGSQHPSFPVSPRCNPGEPWSQTRTCLQVFPRSVRFAGFYDTPSP